MTTFETWFYSDLNHKFAWSLGMIATCLFSFVYFPQMLLNYKRKHTEGFSETSMIIKLIGGAYLLVNAAYAGEPSPVVCYGLFGFAMYSVLLGQIGYYNKRYHLLLWIFLFPVVPFLTTVMFPWTTPITNSFKPFTQIFSHVAQLLLVWKKKTASGVALTSQHLNWIGAWAGLYMCLVLKPNNTSTYFLYYNSVFQAGSFYAAVLFFDGTRAFLRASAITSWLVAKDQVIAQ